MANDRALIKTIVHRRLGNRDDLATAIEENVDSAQDELEDDVKLGPAWFLAYDTDANSANLSTVASQNYLSLPTGHMLEVEDGGWFRQDTAQTDPWVPLVKDDFDYLKANKTGSGKPTHYAFFGGRIYFFPTPDAVYTIRGMFFKRDDKLVDDTDTNLWTVHAFNLLLNRAGMITAEDIGHNRAYQQFERRHAVAYRSLRDEGIFREEQGKSSTMGD